MTMLEKLKKEIEAVHETKEFKEFKKKSPNSYLCAGFLLIETLDNTPWQMDYYCPDRKIMATIILKGKEAELKETDQISLSKEGVTELNLEKVDYDFEDALKVIDKLLNEKYQGHKANKIITVLQNMKGNETWNITYLTNQFHVLNVKINAESGELISEKLEPVISFNSKEK